MHVLGNSGRNGRWQVYVSCLTTWSLLAIHGNLFTHSSQDNNVGVLLFFLEELGDLVTDFTVWKLDIILESTVLGHQGEETIFGDIEELEFTTGNVGDLHVVGGWGEIFELLASEDINGDKMDLGVTVLSSLGGGHVDDLARALLDDDETVLPQGGTLHRVGGRRTSVGAVEGVLMLRVVRHIFGVLVD